MWDGQEYAVRMLPLVNHSGRRGPGVAPHSLRPINRSAMSKIAKPAANTPKSALATTRKPAKATTKAAAGAAKPSKSVKAVKAAKHATESNPSNSMATMVDKVMEAAKSGTLPKRRVSPPPRNPAFEDAIVFYADMLGFSHQVKNVKAIDGAGALIKVLKRFAEQFTESADTHAFFGRKYWAISDSMVAVWNMKSDAVGVMTEFDAILSQLSGLAFAQGLMMVDDKQLVRGGVARGWFKEIDNTIISPALVDAARIEECIQNPFIGVAKDIYDYFLQHPGRHMYTSSIDPMNDLFIPPCAYTNNQPALDYFMVTIGEIDLTSSQITHSRTLPSGTDRQDYMNKTHAANVRIYIEKHRQFIVDGLATKTGKVLDKYRALREHHNFRIDGRFTDKALLIP